MHPDDDQAVAILGRYGLDGAGLHPVHTGNINRSYLVSCDDGRRYILQRVNPMFAPSVHEDIDAVTGHLRERGLLTPVLVHTRDDELYVTTEKACWRLFDYITGETHAAVTDAGMAYEAAALLARFHHALLDLEHDFRHVRPAVHDTDRHLRNLRLALEQHAGHPLHGQAAALADDILEHAQTLAGLPDVTPRKVHGDPKITNIIFDSATTRAKCLIDFDTLSVMPLYLELGDALRSWCNPLGEDTPQTHFSLPLFHAAVRGYAAEAAGFVTAAEWRAFLPATYRIYLELAARFCADMLNEAFFNWDPRRFPSRARHNEVRALGQLQAARSLLENYAAAQEILEQAFGSQG